MVYILSTSTPNSILEFVISLFNTSSRWQIPNHFNSAIRLILLFWVGSTNFFSLFAMTGV
ncbi:hypothetical protein I7I53_06776 [Histoplasma capsulatum var. duboisii H88]|uniref:Uncharacterized protein n=1 Tax=Ajellomyces capsulatus (strain H88) TaxID=544711 RepID=A0A8A1LCX2_AJEC8|nr:hypothetical protein I7I53_06776 [Histoplasma capsulatum var. duboisii H88]